MNNTFRWLAVCTIALAFATASIAWAQTYTTVDYPGADDTSLNGGPNAEGVAVGSYDAPGIAHGGFTYRRGVFTPVNVPWAGPLGTVPWWPNQDTLVGFYYDQKGAQHGFTLHNGRYTTVDFPGVAGTELTGINPEGDMAGQYCRDVDCNDFHSLIRTRTGQFIGFDPPGAKLSYGATINAAGAMVGTSFTDSPPTDDGSHCYLLYRGRFTTIDFPGAIGTGCGANNAEGDIVGNYFDASDVSHAFLLRNGVFTSFDFPGASATYAEGINSEGTIIGSYFDAAGHLHGFIRTPRR